MTCLFRANVSECAHQAFFARRQVYQLMRRL
jgi:hypothetical protein